MTQIFQRLEHCRQQTCWSSHSNHTDENTNAWELRVQEEGVRQRTVCTNNKVVIVHNNAGQWEYSHFIQGTNTHCTWIYRRICSYMTAVTLVSVNTETDRVASGFTSKSCLHVCPYACSLSVAMWIICHTELQNHTVSTFFSHKCMTL